jgi:hypothetical protein
MPRKVSLPPIVRMIVHYLAVGKGRIRIAARAWMSAVGGLTGADEYRTGQILMAKPMWRVHDRERLV